ncbi:MAG: SpoVA/SpoVAEb family sporulation membrane protein [Eubacteriales bacterium]|nr:SpoVA/SpoVAEb family sporulation membrane protein [Eubacteriales bacterium]
MLPWYEYFIVFGIGGLICMLGQILIITTKITTARILVLFEMIGVFLAAIGIYEPISAFAKAGINVPIIGFGASLAKGAINAVKAQGILGVFTGGVASVAGGLAAAIGFGFLFGSVFKAKTKKF